MWCVIRQRVILLWIFLLFSSCSVLKSIVGEIQRKALYPMCGKKICNSSRLLCRGGNLLRECGTFHHVFLSYSQESVRTKRNRDVITAPRRRQRRHWWCVSLALALHFNQDTLTPAELSGLLLLLVLLLCFICDFASWQKENNRNKLTSYKTRTQIVDGFVESVIGPHGNHSAVSSEKLHGSTNSSAARTSFRFQSILIVILMSIRHITVRVQAF